MMIKYFLTSYTLPEYPQLGVAACLFKGKEAPTLQQFSDAIKQNHKNRDGEEKFKAAIMVSCNQISKADAKYFKEELSQQYTSTAFAICGIYDVETGKKDNIEKIWSKN